MEIASVLVGQHVYRMTSRPYALGLGGATFSELVTGLWRTHLINVWDYVTIKSEDKFG